MATIKEDNNNIPDIIEAIQYLATHVVEIGIFGDNDSKLLMIARVNEFGVDIQVTDAMRAYLHATGLHLSSDTETITIPERAFLRGSFDNNKRAMQKEAESVLNKILQLKVDAQSGLDLIGQLIVTQIQSYMTQLSSPANHPYTVDKKGSSNPLIDTGKLRDEGITYKVRSA